MHSIQSESDRKPSRRPNQGQNRSERVALALKIVGLIVVSGIMLEVGWRLYLMATGRGFLDDPRKFTSPFFTIYDRPRPFISSDGLKFRNGHVDFNKGPTEVRIVSLGGSTTVNQRAGISYAEVLETRFRDSRFPFEVRVLNAGGDGYSTAHTLVNLALRILEANPDIIVVYHNINDLSAVWFGSRLEPDYGNKYKSDFYLDFRHRVGLVAELTKISRVARSIASNIKALTFPQQEEFRDRDTGKGQDLFRRNLRSIVAVARTNGVRPVLATQAAHSTFQNDPGFLAYNKVIEEVARDVRADFVDIAGMMQGEDLFRPDAIHYTKEGVLRLADLLYPTLERLVHEVMEERKSGA